MLPVKTKTCNLHCFCHSRKALCSGFLILSQFSEFRDSWDPAKFEIRGFSSLNVFWPCQTKGFGVRIKSKLLISHDSLWSQHTHTTLLSQQQAAKQLCFQETESQLILAIWSPQSQPSWTSATLWPGEVSLIAIRSWLSNDKGISRLWVEAPSRPPLKD